MSKKASKGSGSPIPKIEINLNISPGQGEALLATLQERFEQNTERHADLEWSKIEERLRAHSEKLASLHAMESSGGEPDVVGFDEQTDAYLFMDCSDESPNGRRSICYDRQGLESRKANRPPDNAMDVAHAMGIDLLSEDEYYTLQKLGPFDRKTSSWLKTPEDVRQHGGAIFGDWRYGRVFIYHNGAQSYYGARGFRGVLKV